MADIEHAALSSLSNGSENGVAPRPDSLAPTKTLIDEECVWVSLHQRGWQEGEQGVIEAIIGCLEPHIPVEHRWCVEFGAGDGAGLPLTCDPVARAPGWKSLLIEPNAIFRRTLKDRAPKDAVIEGVCVSVSGENSIDAIMARSNCPPNPAVMVADIDSIEYHIVDAMQSRPIVLCVETLDTKSPKHDMETPYIPSIEEAGTIVDDGFGTQLQANTAAFDALLMARRYTLVFRTRYNSIYVRDDMVPRLRKKKLNLGAGPTKFPGYINLDIKTGNDIRKLAFPDNSIDEVYVSHVLEHFPYEERHLLLAEWVRVLKPWGTLKIAVPDMRKLAMEIIKEEPAHPDAYLEAVVYGGHNDENDHHRAMFKKETLTQCLYAAGLGMVGEFKPFMQDCSQNPYSLNLEGQKRWFPKIEKPKIALVLSQPRITFSGHEKALLEMIRKIDMDIQPAPGAFWDRDTTIGTIAAANSFDPDFLLYSDYDSVFEPEDVQKLIDFLNNNPRAAAVGSVQMSRHNDAPLVLDERLDYSEPITQVQFQHFGLTLIRREVFDELPQPWFWSVPGRDDKGNFDWTAWGRTDADITFWRNIHMLGFRAYQHNEVCIGHIVQAIKYPRKTGKGVMLVPIENYWRQGKPKDVGFDQACYRKKPVETAAKPEEPPPNG